MGKLIGYKVGKYVRVYLSLLWIYVLNKFLGFFVDPEICPLDKVVWNYICIRLYQIIQALTRSLWDGQSCLKFVLGRSSTVPLQTWVPAVTNLLFNYYLLLQKSSFQVGKPQAGTSFQNSLCQNLLTRILAESISLKAPICWKEILSWKTLFLEIVWRLVTSGCLAKPSS